MVVAASPVIRVFASHEWGPGGATHRRVARVVDALRSAGVEVWFDETHMKGNILSAMCRGIDQCDLMLVFVTKRYLDKVETGGNDDNVRREFMYAATTKKPMLAIKLGRDCPKQWKGPVGMLLGSSLYVSLYDDDDDKPLDCSALVDAIHASSSRTLWKHACQAATITEEGGLEKKKKKKGPPPLPRAAPLVRIVEAAVAPCRAPPPPSITTTFLTTGCVGMRDRVHRALDAMGDELRDGEHVGGVVNRLFHSLAGSTTSGGAFCDKLARIERELGLAGA